MNIKDDFVKSLKISNKERGYLITELITDLYIEHEKVKRLERRIDRLTRLICETREPGGN